MLGVNANRWKIHYKLLKYTHMPNQFNVILFYKCLKISEPRTNERNGGGAKELHRYRASNVRRKEGGGGGGIVLVNMNSNAVFDKG